MAMNLEYGKTPLYYVKNGVIEEYVCSGYGEQLVWSDEDEEYRLAEFVYGRNAIQRNICFLANEHPAFEHSPRLGRDLFFSAAEAEEAIRKQKLDEQSATYAGDINAFATKKRKRVSKKGA